MALATPSSSSLVSFCPLRTHSAGPSLCFASLRLPSRRNSRDVEASWSGGAHRLSSTAGAAERWRLGVSFFTSLNSKKRGNPEEIKEELLEAIAPLDRGAEATEEDRERIDQIAQKLEAVNSVKEPFKSGLLDGKWELIYTTSRSILATKRPKILRPNGKIYQSINCDTLRAQNMETWPFFNQVTANLVPLNARRVAVKFDTFKILGLIPIKAPGRARGELEITYVDEEIRVSRGDRGNLFILTMVDRSYRVPT
ncbi:unnamed protein product [Spirodela intermedia]|uniref:Plastid lipid-associated protein/fibrillin conserved domain-containing protein n=2 Tax=Spirodela intermedia TaxID=51605 RepID=A0A7I8J685_SPIIN|nr:unnamed protein product [Spirodela intermedia]CAA6664913.1 unnamed protein product [Spirodela intermedia]CAA7401550.1 unnamed protein product [Spirodela intermedia]